MALPSVAAKGHRPRCRHKMKYLVEIEQYFRIFIFIKKHKGMGKCNHGHVIPMAAYFIPMIKITYVFLFLFTTSATTATCSHTTPMAERAKNIHSNGFHSIYPKCAPHITAHFLYIIINLFSFDWTHRNIGPKWTNKLITTCIPIFFFSPPDHNKQDVRDIQLDIGDIVRAGAILTQKGSDNNDETKWQRMMRHMESQIIIIIIIWTYRC